MDYASPPPRPPRSKLPLIIALAAGAVVVVGGLCCGGGFLLVNFGIGEFQKQVAAELRENPRLVDALGDVESFKIDAGRSMTDQRDDVFVFNVRGSKGSGVVMAKCVTIDADHERIVWATLRLPSGEEIDLLPRTSD